MLEEGIEVLGRSSARPAIREHTEAEAHVGPPTGSGKQPAVAGKAAPGSRLPQDDVGHLHGVIDVGAKREAPEHPRGVHKPGDLGDAAGGAVSPDHHIGTQALAAGQHEAVQGRVVEDGFRRPSDEGIGPGRKGRLLQRRVQGGAR